MRRLLCPQPGGKQPRPYPRLQIPARPSPQCPTPQVVSLLGVLLDYLSSATVAFLPLLRIFRVVRIFKLVPKAKGLRALLQTMLWWVACVRALCCCRAGVHCSRGGLRSSRCGTPGDEGGLSVLGQSRAARAPCTPVSPQVAARRGQRRVRALPLHVPVGHHRHEPVWQHQAGGCGLCMLCISNGCA